MGKPGVATVGEHTSPNDMADADDTRRFLSADNVDSTTSNTDRQEAHFEAGLALSNTNISTSAALTPYTDRAWSIAFLVNVGVTVFAALYFRNSAGKAVHTRRRLAGDDGVAAGVISFVIAMAVMVVLAWGLARGTLHSLASCPERVLQVAYVGFIGVLVCITITMLHSGLVPAGAVSGIFCALLLGYFLKRQSRIRFGAANLKVAAMAVKSMPGTIRIALSMSFVQVVWFMLSSTAAAGSIATFATVIAPDGTTYSAVECQDQTTYAGTGTPGGAVMSCECNSVQVSDGACEYGNARWVLATFWLASCTWGIVVLKNVVTSTVTGSVASWWFSPGSVSAVSGAFYRATHGSFGSLCKAAAIMTAVRVLMHLLRKISLFRRVWFLRYILRRVQAVVGYGLSYAICFISIYGLSFSEAARRVAELFRQRGLTVLLNDGVVAIGLTLIVLGQTMLYLAAMLLVLVVFVGYSWSGFGGFWIMLFAPLFMIPTVVLFWIYVEVVRSSHKAVVVCFVQDPDALRANHDSQTYEDLSEAWRQMQIECPEMASSDNTHMQIECTELSSGDPPHAQKIDSPGTAGARGGGAARGVVLV